MMRIRSAGLAVVFVAGSSALAAAQLPPEPPDPAAIAALVEPPGEDCNGASFYLKAEEAYRRDEMPKPAEETLRLHEDHPAFAAMLQAARCRRFELPYSAAIASPPTDQPIPSSRLYWGAARTLAERAGELRAQGKPDEARREFGRVVVLGLQLYDDPGITYIQQIIALKTIAMGVQGLGDLAIAGGQEETAARCARVLARSRGYLDGLMRFLGEELPLGLLPAGSGLLAQVKKLSGYYPSTTSKPVHLEILLFLSMAQAVSGDPAVRETARGTLASAAKDPDARIGQIARWGLGLDRPAAEKILQELQRHPAPLALVEPSSPGLPFAAELRP